MSSTFCFSTNISVWVSPCSSMGAHCQALQAASKLPSVRVWGIRSPRTGFCPLGLQALLVRSGGWKPSAAGPLPRQCPPGILHPARAPLKKRRPSRVRVVCGLAECPQVMLFARPGRSRSCFRLLSPAEAVQCTRQESGPPPSSVQSLRFPWFFMSTSLCEQEEATFRPVPLSGRSMRHVQSREQSVCWKAVQFLDAR